MCSRLGVQSQVACAPGSVHASVFASEQQRAHPDGGAVRGLEQAGAPSPAPSRTASLSLFAPICAAGFYLFRAGALGPQAAFAACVLAVREAPEQLFDWAGAPACLLLGAFVLGFFCGQLPAPWACSGWRRAGRRGPGRPRACRPRRVSSRLPPSRGRNKGRPLARTAHGLRTLSGTLPPEGRLLARAAHGLRTLPDALLSRVGVLVLPARPLWALLERATRALAALWRRPRDPGLAGASGSLLGGASSCPHPLFPPRLAPRRDSLAQAALARRPRDPG